jgi:hypothetical protein
MAVEELVVRRNLLPLSEVRSGLYIRAPTAALASTSSPSVMRATPLSVRVFLLLSALLSIALTEGCGATHASSMNRVENPVSAESRPKQSKSCDRSDQDTSSVPHSPLFHACAVYSPAHVVRSTNLNFRGEARDRACYSAVVTVAITATGVPEASTVHVVRSTSRDFAEAAVAMLLAARFEPARLGGEPVRQLFELHTALTVHRVEPSSYGPLQPMPGRAPCA